MQGSKVVMSSELNATLPTVIDSDHVLQKKEQSPTNTSSSSSFLHGLRNWETPLFVLIMRFVTSLASLSCVATTLSASIRLPQRATGDLSSWLSTEKGVALQGILNNVGSNGALVPGASSGVVVASPSTVNPNCAYHWSHDAS